jgi:hypothetical protein
VKHYFLRQNLFVEANIIEIVGHTDATAQFHWVDGVRFDRPVPRETLLLDPAYGTAFPDYFETVLPVMSTRMVEALRSSGVSNLDVYPVTLKNQVDGAERLDYSAVNLIGAVDAVDVAKSPHRLRFGKPYFTGAIHLDASRTGDLSAFRLVHGPTFIVVSEPLAQRIAALELSAVLLQPTEDYGGM